MQGIFVPEVHKLEAVRAGSSDASGVTGGFMVGSLSPGLDLLKPGQYLSGNK